jgi:hypothetical protein
MNKLDLIEALQNESGISKNNDNKIRMFQVKNEIILLIQINTR